MCADRIGDCLFDPVFRNMSTDIRWLCRQIVEVVAGIIHDSDRRIEFCAGAR